MKLVNVRAKDNFEKSMLEGLKYCKDNNINIFSGMMGENEQAEVLWNKNQSNNIIDFLKIVKNLNIQLLHFFYKTYEGIDLEDYEDYSNYEEIEELSDYLEKYKGNSYFYIFEFIYNDIRYQYVSFSEWAPFADALEELTDDEDEDENEDFDINLL